MLLASFLKLSEDHIGALDRPVAALTCADSLAGTLGLVSLCAVDLTYLSPDIDHESDKIKASIAAPFFVHANIFPTMLCVARLQCRGGPSAVSSRYR